MCGADRAAERGFCGAGDKLTAAKACLHFYEEPVISGEHGSGAVFFSGCPLKCVFCQNESVSHGGFGAEITPKRLSDIFLSLEQKGAHNINLVTPSHFTYEILKALDIARKTLRIPVVFNSSGYERVETLKLWEGYADIYLPDIKYVSKALSKKYSGAENYFKYALPAVLEMKRQVGDLKYGADKMLKKGLLIRHLVLPGCYKDSIAVLDKIKENIKGEYLVSVMNQYTPTKRVFGTELNRRVSTFEYKQVLNHAAELSLNGFSQGRESADSGYTPNFDLEGIL